MVEIDGIEPSFLAFYPVLYLLSLIPILWQNKSAQVFYRTTHNLQTTTIRFTGGELHPCYTLRYVRTLESLSASLCILSNSVSEETFICGLSRTRTCILCYLRRPSALYRLSYQSIIRGPCWVSHPHPRNIGALSLS